MMFNSKKSIIIKSFNSKSFKNLIKILTLSLLLTTPILTSQNLPLSQDLESMAHTGCNENCLTCDYETSACLLCKNHTSIDLETGKCVSVPEIIENCMYYGTSDPSVCKTCHTGFFGEKCESCGPNCRVCNNNESCMVCNIGFTLLGGNCETVSKVRDCDIAIDDPEKCKLCVEGKFFF